MAGWESGWGLDFLVWISNFGGRTLDIVLEPFHWIGGEYGYVAILPIVFWSLSDRLGRRLYLLAMFSALINGGLKIWWARPRPYQVDPTRIEPFHTESSFGIPSGHTQGGTVFGLFFARESGRRWVKVLLIIAILFMGLSRMIIGVHFLQDVLAGWLLGVLAFAVFQSLGPPVSRAYADSPWWTKIIVALMPALVALGVEALVPAVYPATKNFLATGGAYSGILFGVAAEHRTGRYSSAGDIWKRLLRLPVGILMLLGVNFALSLLFDGVFDGINPNLVLSLFYIGRYAVVGFVGFWLIPEILIRLRLAQRRYRS